MPVVFFAIYLAACGVCGFMGRNSFIGFMGHFMLAIFLSPLVDFLLQVVGRMLTYYRNQKMASRPQ